MLPVLFSVQFCLMYVGSQGVPVPVHGLLHQTVTLSHNLTMTSPVEEVAWHCIINGTRYRLADFRNQQLLTRHNQFSNRLDVDNSGTRLRIRDLRMEDSGMYTESITYTGTSYSTEHRFNLTVYEPVVVPVINVTLENKNTEWCNFTLHCSVHQTNLPLSYTWKRRVSKDTNKRTLQVTLQSKELGYNEWTLPIALNPQEWDTEYQCVVHNPADQKNTSINAQQICHFSDYQRGRYALFLLIPVGLMILLLLVIYSAKRKRKKASNERKTVNELNYIELCMDHRSNPGDQPIYSLQQERSNTPKNSVSTIYVDIQHAEKSESRPTKQETDVVHFQ
ncbi:hypothetical protein GDO86_016550 [Hymenochirus boettgeri]|uniref:Ig-like domain-containing protein n=1 Tax=Hymenochirus boettgeri TaxID=247094 RepID=A0A8T2K5T5_9PIPI|nr:hypothetical protein GDO86_016550 [Hymenochirus boettgeri]